MLFIRLLFILTVLSNIGLYVYSHQNTPKQQHFIAVDAGVESLELLSELKADSTIWEEDKKSNNDNTKEKEINTNEIFNQVCFSVGAFNTKSEIQPILELLKNDVIKIRTRKIISTQEAGYWVFIPAENSREEALNIGRKLSQMNIKDYYVVTGGENENTISLGLYREQINAESRLQDLIAIGFNAKKIVRIEQWPEFWLDYAIAEDQIQKLGNINDLNTEVSSNKVTCNW